MATPLEQYFQIMLGLKKKVEEHPESLVVYDLIEYIQAFGYRG